MRATVLRMTFDPMAVPDCPRTPAMGRARCASFRASRLAGVTRSSALSFCIPPDSTSRCHRGVIADMVVENNRIHYATDL